MFDKIFCLNWNQNLKSQLFLFCFYYHFPNCGWKYLSGLIVLNAEHLIVIPANYLQFFNFILWSININHLKYFGFRLKLIYFKQSKHKLLKRTNKEDVFMPMIYQNVSDLWWVDCKSETLKKQWISKHTYGIGCHYIDRFQIKRYNYIILDVLHTGSLEHTGLCFLSEWTIYFSSKEPGSELLLDKVMQLLFTSNKFLLLLFRQQLAKVRQRNPFLTHRWKGVGLPILWHGWKGWYHQQTKNMFPSLLSVWSQRKVTMNSI